ncbi:hypothetical protein Hanom_Chr02g00124861 [Helianthus anomalus]
MNEIGLNLIIVANSVMCAEQSISSHSDDSAIGWGVTYLLRWWLFWCDGVTAAVQISGEYGSQCRRKEDQP